MSMPYGLMGYKKYQEMIKIPEDVTYPVCIEDIPKWEELNDIKVNVFLSDDKNKPYRNDKYFNYKRSKNIVNMILLENECNNHFVWCAI